ncbi:hypothetical protein ILUMI_00049 [Ignelater luminosus]|uniref:Protein DIS3 homolog n=1 Tax=Ignelater luminosus TaxID=2038154 RepID=A0A8K0GQM6_IGNLU|nr:hypothetical protein ILUMI_00049 [Ignelater luminosus]
MLTTKSFIKKNKIGNVLKNIREHYLRNDIFCGFDICERCSPANSYLSSTHVNNCSLFLYNHYIILDTNVILDQMDILDENVIGNVIILHTVLQEVKNRSLPMYKRLRSVIENPSRHFYVFANDHHKDCYLPQEETELINDYNDRCIRKACLWYMEHIREARFVFITDDNANRQRALSENIISVSVKDYVTHLDKAQFLEDKLAKHDFHVKVDAEGLFPPHCSTFQIHNGIKESRLYQATYHASRDNYLEGFAMVDGFEDSILLQGRSGQNRAVDGDIVAIELLNQNEWVAPSEMILEDESIADTSLEDALKKEDELKTVTHKKKGDVKPTGRVVGIIRRKWRQYCGILQQDGSDTSVYQLFVPADKKIPKIRIETRQAAALRSQKIIVAIDSWPCHSRYPNGHFVRALGKIGDQSTENEVVLLEHDVPHNQFSEEVLSCLPKLPWIITDEDVEARVDLRHIDICSVDPPGCTDIDDALHCRPIDDGNLEVGVHIADVSHFIRPGTAIDLEAAKRATTVYLVNKRIDMVPELLSSNLCSLRGGEERFAFSCIWIMDKKANILHTRFHKSIIKSKKAMTYEEAQITIDDKNRNDSIALSLRNLNMLAKILKRRRLENGALVLASPEVKIQMDSETMDPIDVEVKKLFETNSMVEEFMLLANISVAEKILASFPDCAMLRRHPEPPSTNFEPLIKAGKHLGFDIRIDTGKNLAVSLDAAVRDDNPYFNTMLRILATRCMLQAIYFPSGMYQKNEFFHYGLAVPLYTHFTSPIRRYADIIVHRLLAVSIGADATYPDLLDKRKSNHLCQNLNYRNRMAQYAGRASIAFNTHLFFRGKIQDEEGYVLYIRKNAIQILIPKYGLECTLYLAQKGEKSAFFEYNEEDQNQSCGNIVLHAFDPVTVRLSLDSNNIQHEKFTLQLVSPYIEGFSVPPLNKPSRKQKLEDTGSKSPPEAKRKKKSRKH